MTILIKMENTNNAIELESLEELSRKTWEIYKVGLWKFINLGLINLVGFIPFIIILVVFFISGMIFKDAVVGNVMNVALGIFGIASLAFLVYLSLATLIARYLLLKNFSNERKIIDLLKESTPYVGKMFWVSILTAGLLLLWFLCLVIPALIFGVYYAFATYVLVFEDISGMDAIKRSKELVKGRWFQVFLRLAAVNVAIYIFFLILGIPSDIIKDTKFLYYSWNLIILILRILVSPIPFIFTYFIYKDLVKKFASEKVN